MLCCHSPQAPTPMMPISATFTHRAMAALSVRSASVPEAPENRKNGAMNSAPASITSEGGVKARFFGETIGHENPERRLRADCR